MADRFYCPDPPVSGHFTLEGDEARHLLRVRRLGLRDQVELFDGRGYATCAEVTAVGRDRVELTAVGTALADRPLPCRLTLATAVPKGERFDWLIEKATELGVTRLVPIITERSVVDPRDAKLERLRRRVVEASKQCGRNRLMEVERPTPWSTLLKSVEDDVRLMAHPNGSPRGRWPRSRNGQGASVTLAVGPEGGFSDVEVDEAQASGWSIVGLGPTILRIETAGLVGATSVLAQYEGGDE
ncbi:RsmE family RNA methyltransferase [Singulisphaera acidiphila]|uniref:Ribosomal RNA small subunit methyltransferase E n=1 Tax=Singulisphaera acidiphila (strain ATCC BAA-1392 / DSM 18658 / VKM B-2454 / MOB10) TaxID=886293 RepID=L0DAQ3_SINAD|nr:16S rRNA (uracil(1498)-N(3))-methyltransferase [Singulisphaera acidiphila]AGA25920.1 RNA methyltransferase, RsmE family [Singulisphaera acidiphila DSM 18658]